MKLRRWALSGALLLSLSPIAAPQLLAFPYSTQVAGHRVYSEVPITPRLASEVANADRLAERSRIAQRARPQPIFLTDGGWRWTWLTLTSRTAFAITRPLIETIVVNRSDQGSDMVFRPAKVGGQLSLTGTLAHEMTHGAIRGHFGLKADFRYPAWLREGYCDFVAGGGSLTDEEAAALTKSDPNHAALVYWRGRKQVEAELKRNGGSVYRLFATQGA
jgi:hypothetical protein